MTYHVTDRRLKTFGFVFLSLPYLQCEILFPVGISNQLWESQNKHEESVSHTISDFQPIDSPPTRVDIFHLKDY